MPTNPPLRRAANQERMGDFNQTVVLEAIRRSGEGVSRVELAEVTGLSPQSVTNIVRQLIEDGLVREGERTPIGRGKPRTLLNLEPTGRHAVGVHLDPAMISYVVLDLCGRTVASYRRAMPDRIEPEMIMDELADDIGRLLVETGLPGDRLSGVGVATPGRVDVARGTVVDPPHLAGWDQVPLREGLHRRLDRPVLLDKDVLAAAAAQKWIGSLASSNFVFLYLGTGLGGGVVLDNAVLRGASSNVGEIGHIMVDPLGPECHCGRRGCVGEACEPRFLVNEAITSGLLDPVDLGDRAEVEDALTRLTSAAVSGDPRGFAIMDELAGRLCRAAEVIASLLDLEHVVFGGPHWPLIEPFFGEHYRRELGRRFSSRRVHPLTVVGSDLGENAGAIGAAVLVLDHTFSTDPAVLLAG